MQYGFPKPEYENFPPIVHVETTNVCNLRCIHCPHTDVKNIIPNYSANYMELPLWRRVVDEVSKYPVAIRLTPDGEPMLTKDWVEQVEYALKKKVSTFTFNTHGMFLEGEKADVLLKECDTDIVVEISLDGLFRDTYDAIRVKSDYKRVLRNVLDFISRRDSLGRENVKVMVSIVAQPEVTSSELEAFDRFWAGIADKVIVRNYVDTKGLTPKKNIEDRVLSERWPCLVVFTRLIVTWDGRVRFCPDDWLKETVLEKLDDTNSLRSIWQSEKFVALRRSHLEGSFDHPTCKKCTDWKVIRWGQDYTTALEALKNENSKSDTSESSLSYVFQSPEQTDERHDNKPLLVINNDG